MPRRSLADRKADAEWVFRTLESTYPPITTFLTHDGPFQLLIAVILSAQCTDERVNMVTPALFEAYPDAQSLADAAAQDVEDAIKSINFFRNKAKNIQKTAQILVEDYDSVVPADLSALVQLPGVGRKTANVVLGQAFGIPGITVDTHVNRLSRRLGFTKNATAETIERDLMKLWDDSWWIDFSSLLILHGREVCNARKPHCERCVLAEKCPSSTSLGHRA